MALRTRERSFAVTGQRIPNWGGPVESNVYINRERMVDEVAPGDNYPIRLDRKLTQGGLIFGREASNRSGYDFQGYPCSYVSGNSIFSSHLVVPGRPTNESMAAQALARSQPLAPAIISWEYLNEIGQYGDLAKNAMAAIVSQLPRMKGNNLRTGRPKREPPPLPDDIAKYRKYASVLRGGAAFGVIAPFVLGPLLSDIEKLMVFSELVDQRTEVLKRLYGGTGYRRTMPMWKGSATETRRNETIQSSGVLLKADVTRTTTMDIRAHVRWRSIIPVVKTDIELRAQARRVLSGFRADPHTAYELMPWSWLIDYFTNIGAIIKANKNLLELTYDRPAIIEYTRSEVSSSNHTSASGVGGTRITCTPMVSYLETKRRDHASASIIAREAYLTVDQTSILGSLAVLHWLK